MTEYEIKELLIANGVVGTTKLSYADEDGYKGDWVVEAVNLAIADAEEKKKKARKKAKRFKRLYLEKCMECDTLLKQMSEMCSENERGVKIIY